MIALHRYETAGILPYDENILTPANYAFAVAAHKHIIERQEQMMENSGTSNKKVEKICLL
jgi:uncharacterized membrane protein